MTPERRTHARRILYSPEYLDMGADNGGMVVNLSETGLGFQAVGPVLPQTEIPISFSLGTGYRIDVRARVAWVNGEGKIGGVIFGKLSKDSRSLIHEWLSRTDAVHKSGRNDAEQGEGPAPSAAAPAVTVAGQESRVGQTAASGAGSRPLPVEEDAVRNGVVPPTHGIKEGALAVRAAHDISAQTAPVSHPAPPVPPPQSATSGQDRPASPSIDPIRQRLPTAAPPQESTAGTIFQRRSVSTPIAPEEKQEPRSGGSFSVVPSISAWSKSDVPGTFPAQEHGTILFPSRNSENIFARSPSHPVNEHEGGRSGKLFVLGIVIAAAAVGAFYVRTHRQQIGTAIANIGNRVAGNSASGASVSANSTAAPSGNVINSPPTNRPSPSVQNSPVKPQAIGPVQSSSVPATAKQGTNPLIGSAGSPASIGNNPKPSAAQPNAPSTALSHQVTGSIQPSDGKPKSANPNTPSRSAPLAGQSEYQRAEQYLNGKGVAQDYGEAAQWFWRSLEAGYTNAALPLANLYLEGNGVSRSCAQARILLDAAAQKNNAQAIQKLAQLPENCQ